MRKYFLGGIIIVLILSASILVYYKTRPQKITQDLNPLTTSYQYPFGLIQYTDSGFNPQVLKLKAASKARIVLTNTAHHDVTITSTNSSTSLNVGTIPHGKKGYFKTLYLEPGQYEFVNTLNSSEKGLIVIEK